MPIKTIKNLAELQELLAEKEFVVLKVYHPDIEERLGPVEKEDLSLKSIAQIMTEYRERWGFGNVTCRSWGKLDAWLLPEQIRDGFSFSAYFNESFKGATNEKDVDKVHKFLLAKWTEYLALLTLRAANNVENEQLPAELELKRLVAVTMLVLTSGAAVMMVLQK